MKIYVPKRAYTEMLLAALVVPGPITGRMTKQWNTTQHGDEEEWLLIHSAILMSLKNSMLSQGSLIQSNQYCTFPFIWCSGIGNCNLHGTSEHHNHSGLWECQCVEGSLGVDMEELPGVTRWVWTSLGVWVILMYIFQNSENVHVEFCISLYKFYLKRNNLVNKYLTSISKIHDTVFGEKNSTLKCIINKGWGNKWIDI